MIHTHDVVEICCRAAIMLLRHYWLGISLAFLLLSFFFFFSTSNDGRDKCTQTITCKPKFQSH